MYYVQKHGTRYPSQPIVWISSNEVHLATTHKNSALSISAYLNFFALPNWDHANSSQPNLPECIASHPRGYCKMALCLWFIYLHGKQMGSSNTNISLTADRSPDATCSLSDAPLNADKILLQLLWCLSSHLTKTLMTF